MEFFRFTRSPFGFFNGFTAREAEKNDSRGIFGSPYHGYF
jgi:hypothetical protein